MSDTASIVRHRRARRAEGRRTRDVRFRMGGVGLGIVFSLLLAVLILLAALTYADLTRDLPNVGMLPALLNPPDGLLLQPTRVYDRTEEHLLFTFAPNDVPRRYIPLNPQTPQHLPDFLATATVAAADPGFWRHGGYLISGWGQPELHPTVAQKLVSELLLYDEPPSFRRALRERILAAQITAKYGRTQILEWYLNSADYGNHAFGADAASRLYFGKSASELTPAEATVLAATGEAPSLNPFDARDVALGRGRDLVQEMESFGLISPQQASQALAISPSPLLPSSDFGTAQAENPAPAFLNLALDQLDRQFTRDRIERGGLTIITTLDYDLQEQTACATLAYSAQLAGLPAPSTPCDAARLLPSLPIDAPIVEPSASALVLDPQSGQILAAVGETLEGRGETTFLSPHTPGSLLTPFVYLTAFTRGLSPGSLVWDIPSAVDIQNPDGQFHGPVRVRIALVNDYLVPARNIADQMGTEAVGRTEASFGLNGGDASLLDISTAYAALAAQGVRYGQPAPVAVLRVEALDHTIWLDWSNPQAQPILAPQLAYLIDNVLSDEPARWPSLGHPNPLEIGRPAGVKLGQTDDGRDVWAVGYTPTRLVTVWTGTHAADSARLSPRLPAALWNTLMQFASVSQPAAGWAMPAGVTVMNVCDPSGLLPTRDCPAIVSEVFLNGNEPVQADNLYRMYSVNRETGYLATVFTPPQLIEDRIFMAVPSKAQAWAKSAGIPVAPTSYDAIQAAPIDPEVHISSPAMFADVNGQVQIKGSASGGDFDHYRLLVGQGLNPQQWVQVGTDATTPVVDGILATWNTAGLNGLYAVQLQVIRTDQRVDTAVIQVTVTNK
jgi:membrane peptidoglycan carboxypeptidase